MHMQPRMSFSFLLSFSIESRLFSYECSVVLVVVRDGWLIPPFCQTHECLEYSVGQGTGNERWDSWEEVGYSGLHGVGDLGRLWTVLAARLKLSVDRRSLRCTSSPSSCLQRAYCSFTSRDARTCAGSRCESSTVF
jgi:hypothetical protein